MWFKKTVPSRRLERGNSTKSTQLSDRADIFKKLVEIYLASWISSVELNSKFAESVSIFALFELGLLFVVYCTGKL